MTDANFAPLYEAVRRMLAERGRIVAAIDGDAAAGKTTLAAALCKTFGGACVHMDDFFLPPEMRTKERLAAPGGNVHVERFLEEVAPRLGKGAFSYRRFDCARMALAEAVCVPDAPLVVVEGSYSMLPALQGCYDLTMFLAVGADEQMRRVTARSPEKAEMFRTRWIPMEKAYQAAFSVCEACDFRFDT